MPVANTKSAIKRMKQNEKRRQRNRATRSNLRSTVKAARAAIATPGPEAKDSIRQAIRTLDRAVTQGLIHRRVLVGAGTGRTGMGAHHRTIDHEAFEVGVGPKKRQHVSPNSPASPPDKAAIDRVPTPLIRRQESPWCATAEPPEYRVDKPTALRLPTPINPLLLLEKAPDFMPRLVGDLGVRHDVQYAVLMRDG